MKYDYTFRLSFTPFLDFHKVLFIHQQMSHAASLMNVLYDVCALGYLLYKQHVNAKHKLY